MTEDVIRDWVEGYRLAWETVDSEAAANLFTDGATYRDNIYGEPNRGRDGVAAYWTGVTATQTDVSVRMGNPVIDGDRVVVEFWTNMAADGEPVTLAGALLLDFDEASGLCHALREYYAFTPGTVDPPEGWGV